jgi:hypothetical protein
MGDYDAPGYGVLRDDEEARHSDSRRAVTA